MGSSPVSLGASGCTFGLIGGIAAYLYRNKSVLGKQAEQGLSSIKQTMFINLMYVNTWICRGYVDVGYI